MSVAEHKLNPPNKQTKTKGQIEIVITYSNSSSTRRKSEI